jgi:transcription elongation GreA/GreB family factor
MYLGMEIAGKMNKTEKINYKKRLVELCKMHLDKTAGNSRIAMAEAQNSANEYGQPKDRYDSYRAQVLRKRDMFAGQLQQTMGQLACLDQIGVDQLHDKVEFGSVVFTDKQNIFIATGIGKLKFEEGDVFVISPNVPIFDALKGKASGDEVDFRGNKIKIKDVF